MDSRQNSDSSQYILTRLQEVPAVFPVIENTELTLQLKIGEGTYGVVHTATWNNKLVAVKRMNMATFNLKRECSETRKYVCNNEKEIMGILYNYSLKQSHPNIITCYGYNMDSNHCSLILDYLSGGSVKDYRDKNQFINNSQRYWEIVLDTAKGLDYLHNHDIIHGDLKIENLLLDSFMNVKIIDFGFSLYGKATTTRCLGTVVSMAPELIEETETNLTPYSPASDIYAFAIILYKLFVDLNPYPKARKDEDILWAACHNQRPALPPTCPARNLIPRCWEHDRNQRPNAKELVKSVEVETENYFKLAR
jgi:serine/threonine protein kinase